MDEIAPEIIARTRAPAPADAPGDLREWLGRVEAIGELRGREGRRARECRLCRLASAPSKRHAARAAHCERGHRVHEPAAPDRHPPHPVAGREQGAPRPRPPEPPPAPRRPRRARDRAGAPARLRDRLAARPGLLEPEHRRLAAGGGVGRTCRSGTSKRQDITLPDSLQHSS